MPASLVVPQGASGNSMFAELLSRSFDEKPAMGHESFVQNTSVTLDQQIERDALQYLTAQLSALKQQVSQTLNNPVAPPPSSVSHHAKHVSFTPEPLEDHPTWRNPAPSTTMTGGGRHPHHDDISHLHDPLWQRTGMGATAVDLSTTDILSDTSALPEFERKERQSFALPPRPPASATRAFNNSYNLHSASSLSSKVRFENNSLAGTLDSFESKMSSLGEEVEAVRGFEALSDGGYYEGYWKAKYQRTNR